MPSAVSQGTSDVRPTAPSFAAIPDIPASVPTVFPLNRSAGNVWMLPIAVWKPNRITAMISTATTGAPGFAIANRAGNMIRQPRLMVNLRVLLTFQPAFMRFWARIPPNHAPNIAPT